MRIISKFHDYYDKGMGTGYDNSLLFVRKKEEKYVDNKLPCVGRSGFRDLNFRGYSIGFCGKLYLCVHINVYIPYTPSSDMNYYVYDIENLNKIVKQHVSEKDFHTFDRNYKKFKRYFSDINKISYTRKDFEGELPPIFVMQYKSHQKSVVFNERLKNYEFYRIFLHIKLIKNLVCFCPTKLLHLSLFQKYQIMLWQK